MVRAFSVLLVFTLIGLVGCSQERTPTKAEDSDGKKKTEPEHVHKPGQHGGTIVSIGSDNYHAEPVFEKGGRLRLYMLGKDENRVMEVAAEPLHAYIKAAGDMEPESIILKPDPTPDDKKGKTSRFLAQIPPSLVGKKVEVTVYLRIGEDRFRVAFKSAPDRDDHGMPTKIADDEERKLYLTPGGKYTVADIKANGDTTPSNKFKGVKAEHDFKPKAGDPLCPITFTKANPRFSWVIDGKNYTFCCPPCIDEFVGLAKEKPEEVKVPDEYIKK